MERALFYLFGGIAIFPLLFALRCLYLLRRTATFVQMDQEILRLRGPLLRKSIPWNRIARIRVKNPSLLVLDHCENVVLYNSAGKKLGLIRNIFDNFPQLVREIEFRSSASRGEPEHQHRLRRAEIDQGHRIAGPGRHQSLRAPRSQTKWGPADRSEMDGDRRSRTRERQDGERGIAGVEHDEVLLRRGGRRRRGRAPHQQTEKPPRGGWPENPSSTASHHHSRIMGPLPAGTEGQHLRRSVLERGDGNRPAEYPGQKVSLHDLAG